MNLETFGTEARFLRPSSLDKLLACPMSVLLAEADDGSEGAHVGTCVHKGVEAWHTTLSSEAALGAMRAALKTFPDTSAAGVKKAEKWTAAYVADPKNNVMLTGRIEVPVTLRLAGDVWIKGTLDQLRRGEDGRLTVWDLKTGVWLSAQEARLAYQYQQAAYVLAARQTLNADVHPGGLIYANAYSDARPQPFVSMQVSIDDCEAMMEEVRLTVLDLRRGRVRTTPGPACKWCKQPKFPLCQRKFRSLL